MSNTRLAVRIMEPVLLRSYTRDTLLTTPTKSELDEWGRRTAKMIGYDPGMTWVGDWRSRLDKLSPSAALVAVSDRIVSLSRAAQKDASLAEGAADEAGELTSYLNDRNRLGSSTARSGPAGSLAFTGGVGVTPDDIQRSNEQFWADRLGRSPAKDSAGPGLSTRATPDSINAANASFWANR
jgi:hypothetical protein